MFELQINGAFYGDHELLGDALDQIYYMIENEDLYTLPELDIRIFKKQDD